MVSVSATNTPVAATTQSGAPLGTYYRNVDAAGKEQVIIAPGRPIQPKVVTDVSVVSPVDSTKLAEVAHGAIVLDMSSTYVSLPDPVIATPVFDPEGVEPAIPDTAFPSKPLEITTTTGPAGVRQQLVLATGQYRPSVKVQRLDDPIEVAVYYADPSETDFTPPTIGKVDSQLVAGRLSLTVTSNDLDTDRVYALVVQNPGLGSRTWTGIDLVRAPGTQQWTGSLVLAPGTVDVESIVQARDSAGNVGFATNKANNFNTVEQPAPPPPPASALTAAPSTPPSPGGFYTGPVTITVTSSSTATYKVDGVSKGNVPISGSFTITGDGAHTWSVTNLLYTQTGGVLIDTAPPVVTLDRAPGILRPPTTVRISASDAGAGVASVTFSATGDNPIPSTTVSTPSVSVPLTTEGTTTITVTALDGAGRTSLTVTAMYTIDSTAPTVTASPAPGLRNSPVDVTLTASDTGTGVASVTYSLSGATTKPSTTVSGSAANVTPTISAQGATTVTATATDVAGNVSTPLTLVYTIDTVPPVITCPSPAPTYIVNQPGATLTAQVTDPGGSGPTSPTVSATVPTAAAGYKSITLNATDVAGNQTNRTCPVAVTYNVSGFDSPIDMGVVNSQKAGSNVPVKWTLTDFNGVGVNSLGSFVSLTSSAQACVSSNPTDVVVLTSGSGVKLKNNGKWQFNWKTQKGQKGCRILTLNVTGASAALNARFEFK